MRDFREEIRRNRLKLRLFLAALLLLSLWAGRLAGTALDHSRRDPYAEEFGYDPGPSLYVHAMTLCIPLLAWVTYRRMRRRGDRLVLALADARPLQDLRVANVNDEMALAAGIERPRLWIIEKPEPNAFACGLDEKTASIAVTRGLLDLLDRDELQAVLAHEMAHIRNGDTRLMTTLLGMTRGFWLLSALVIGPLRAMAKHARSAKPVELTKKQKTLLVATFPLWFGLAMVASILITAVFYFFTMGLPWLVLGYVGLDLVLGDRLAELERKTDGIGKYALFAPVGLATGPVILILGLFVPVVHLLMRLAVSRNREYQADATAVAFTRNPGALAGALRKLERAGGGGLKRRLSPLTIAPVGAILSTHPPLAERIRRVAAMEAAPARQLVFH